MLLANNFNNTLGNSSSSQGAFVRNQAYMRIFTSNEIIVEGCFLGSDPEDSACKARDGGSVHGSGRSPWRREWLRIPVFLPGNPHGQQSLASYRSWAHRVGHVGATEHAHSLVPQCCADLCFKREDTELFH